MSLFESSLVGKVIHSVHVDSEVTYLMLEDGTHVSIHGLVVVEPDPDSFAFTLAAPSQEPIA